MPVRWWDHWYVPGPIQCFFAGKECAPCLERCARANSTSRDEEDIANSAKGQGTLSGGFLKCVLKNPTCQKAYEECPDLFRHLIEDSHGVEAGHVVTSHH